jgi:hypothetical protein
LGSIFNSQQDTSSSTAPAQLTGAGTGTGIGTAASGTGSSGGATGTDASSATGATATDANGNPIAGTGTNGLSSSGTTAGQTFGGAGIIGVTPASPKESLLIYKKKNHYNEWEFDYDPSIERMTVGSSGAGLNGTPASNMSSPIGNSGLGTNSNTFGGGQPNSSPFGGGSGTQPTQPTSPQQ